MNGQSERRSRGWQTIQMTAQQTFHLICDKSTPILIDIIDTHVFILKSDHIPSFQFAGMLWQTTSKAQNRQA